MSPYALINSRYCEHVPQYGILLTSYFIQKNAYVVVWYLRCSMVLLVLSFEDIVDATIS